MDYNLHLIKPYSKLTSASQQSLKTVQPTIHLTPRTTDTCMHIYIYNSFLYKPNTTNNSRDQSNQYTQIERKSKIQIHPAPHQIQPPNSTKSNSPPKYFSIGQAAAAEFPPGRMQSRLYRRRLSHE